MPPWLDQAVMLGELRRRMLAQTNPRSRARWPRSSAPIPLSTAPPCTETGTRRYRGQLAMRQPAPRKVPHAPHQAGRIHQNAGNAAAPGYGQMAGGTWRIARLHRLVGGLGGERGELAVGSSARSSRRGLGAGAGRRALPGGGLVVALRGAGAAGVPGRRRNVSCRPSPRRSTSPSPSACRRKARAAGAAQRGNRAQYERGGRSGRGMQIGHRRSPGWTASRAAHRIRRSMRMGYRRRSPAARLPRPAPGWRRPAPAVALRPVGFTAPRVRCPRRR